MKDLSFTLNGDPLWVCDMRPGVSQDGISVVLPAEKYRCRVTRSEESGLLSISYTCLGASLTSEEKIGELSLDMARLGVVELAPLLDEHRGNWDALADWSDEAADAHSTDWGGYLRKRKSHAVYFSIGSDCVMEVYRLRVGRRVIGMCIKPKALIPVTPKLQRWTWVEVKLNGIGEPWSFCDDWTYDPDEESIFDNIDSELSYFTDSDIDHSAPLSIYCRKIYGVAAISVFIEDQGRPRRSITKSIDSPEMPVSPTSKQLCLVIFELFIQSRKLA